MANEITNNISRSITVSGFTVGGVVSTILSDGAVEVRKLVPANSTNAEFDVSVTIANVQIMGIECDHDATVIGNSTGTPAFTLTLKANHPMLWNAGTDLSGAKFITVDITKFFVTTGVVATIFKFAAGVDDTPVLTP